MALFDMIFQLVFPGEAVVSTELASDDMAGELFSVPAVFGRVVALDVGVTLGGELAVLLLAREGCLRTLNFGPAREVAFFVGDYIFLEE